MENTQSKYEELKEQGRFDLPVAKESIETFNTKEDHFKIKINGVDLGEWEKSQIRHFIEVLDKCAN